MAVPDWLLPFLDKSAPVSAAALGAEGWLTCRIWTSDPDAVVPLEESSYTASMLVVRCLGEGGMGLTLLVINPQDGELTVCKVPNENAPRDRFEEEIRLLSRVSHDHIVRFRARLTLESSDASARRPAYLMEYVSGGSLLDLLTCSVPGSAPVRRRLPLFEALRIFEEIIEGLEAIHAQNVRHRDLKPENVLFDVTHGRRAKLCDFGIAKDDNAPSLTPANVIVPGTYRYQAPEVVSAPKSVDHRADYFSAGCILAEMLCGRHTFKSEWGSTTIDNPDGLDEIGAWYQRDVRSLVADLLQKSPASRFVDPEQIRKRIHDILQRQRSKTRTYWSANWPALDAAMESQLRAFLFDDARSFRHGRLPRIGSLLGLHAERTELVEFGSALEEIHRRIWLIMTQLRTRAVVVTSEVDSQAYLLRQLEEVRSNCDQLLDLIDGRIPASLQSRLNSVEPDARLLRSFQVLSRRAASAYRRERSAGVAADVQRRLDAYHQAMANLWRAWLRLQMSVVERISQVSDLLVVAMAAIR